jgi:two-component system nitrogen regulation response regulator NtrX
VIDFQTRRDKDVFAGAMEFAKDRLKNLIERIVILNPQVRVDARHIPLGGTRKPVERTIERFGSLQEVREAAEREYILKKLDEANGNVTRTAELLGLERSNLYRKMKTLGIGPKE